MRIKKTLRVMIILQLSLFLMQMMLWDKYKKKQVYRYTEC